MTEEIEEQIESSSANQRSDTIFVESSLDYVKSITSVSGKTDQEFKKLDSSIERYEFIKHRFIDQIENEHEIKKQFFQELLEEIIQNNISYVVKYYPISDVGDNEVISEIFSRCMKRIIENPERYLLHIDPKQLDEFLLHLNQNSLSEIEKNSLSFVFLSHFTKIPINDYVIHINRTLSTQNIYNITEKEAIQAITNKLFNTKRETDKDQELQKQHLFRFGLSMGLTTVFLAIFAIYAGLVGITVSGFLLMELFTTLSIISSILSSISISIALD